MIDKKKRVSLSDVLFAYEEDESFIFESIREDLGDMELKVLRYDIGLKRVSEKLVLDALTQSPDSIIITSNPVKLGNFGVKININELYADTGYLAFWVKNKKRTKYIKGV